MEDEQHESHKCLLSAFYSCIHCFLFNSIRTTTINRSCIFKDRPGIRSAWEKHAWQCSKVLLAAKRCSCYCWWNSNRNRPGSWILGCFSKERRQRRDWDG